MPREFVVEKVQRHDPHLAMKVLSDIAAEPNRLTTVDDAFGNAAELINRQIDVSDGGIGTNDIS